jgi:hypothetical protein
MDSRHMHACRMQRRNWVCLRVYSIRRGTICSQPSPVVIAACLQSQLQRRQLTAQLLQQEVQAIVTAILRRPDMPTGEALISSVSLCQQQRQLTAPACRHSKQLCLSQQ